MPIPNNPKVVKVAFVFSRDNRTFINTFHVADPDGWDAASMHTLAVDMAGWWTLHYAGDMPAGVSLQQIQVRLLDPSNPLAEDYTTGLPVAGGTVAAMEAANVTSTLSWRTGLAGRKYRGRTYVPSIAETQTTQDDKLTGAMSTALSIIANAFITAVTSGNRVPVVFHAATNTFTQIVSYVIENILDSQRRRLPNRGR